MTVSTASYQVPVSGATFTTANTEEWYIVITPPAAVSLRIKKIRFKCNAGTGATAVDRYFKLKICSLTGAPTTGTSSTPRSINENLSVAQSTCLVRSGTAATSFTGGTITKTFDTISLWYNLQFEWYAMDADDQIVLIPGEKFGLGGTSSTSSQTFTASVVWSES